MKNMKAIVYANGTANFRMLAPPAIKHDDDVLISIVQTGLCGTDLNVIKGLFPASAGIIMGHETVGVVDAVGRRVQEISVADRVVIDPTMWCGVCERCRDGRHNQCLNKQGREVGLDFHGAFAERAVYPEQFVFRIPDHITDDQAVFTEPMACVLNNFDAANAHPISTVLVLGGGPIGALAAMYARRFFLNSAVMELDDSRIRILSNIGLSVIRAQRNADRESNSKVIRDHFGGVPNLVIDTTGALLADAVEYVEPGGIVVPMGFNIDAIERVRTQTLVSNAVRIVGAGDYNWHMQKAIRVLPSLPVEDLITHRLEFGPFVDRMKEMASGTFDSALKVMLTTSNKGSLNA